MKLIPKIPQSVCSFAVHQLASVDYNVANRVTHDVANIVDWSYQHNVPFLATFSVEMLHIFDDIGSVLITIVLWMMHHS